VKLAPVFALLAVAATACRQSSPPASSARPNILLITIDTLRADRVGRGLTPAIDALAARGIRFTHARSAVPLTLPSHVSIMTGRLPPAHGIRLNGDAGLGDTPTIARVLHDAGYRTGAFVGAYVLDRRFGLGDGFDVYDDRVHRDPSGNQQLEAQRRGDAVVDAALGWLNSNVKDPRPFFAWVHLYDPHTPYEPPPEYLEKAGRNPYDGEVAFADLQVGRLLDWLSASKLTANTVVTIAGDHGEGLGDHGELTHGMLAYDSTLRVPLVLAVPNRDPAVDEAPVSLVEVAGTLLQLAGRQLPGGMHPGSLVAGEASEHEAYAETRYPASAGWHPLAALADERWKLIQSSELELYDVAADPSETINLAASKGSVVDAMRQRLATLGTATAAATATAVPSDAAERLRALGYVSGSASPSADADSAPNPARHIAAWNTFEKELTRLTGGDARGALPGLAGLARAFPDAPVFQATHARALKETGRVRDAVDVYRRAVRRWPQDASLYHDLAVAADAAGLHAEAARAEQASLALQPSNPAAANGLGLLQVQAGKTVDAVPSFEAAVKGDPTNAAYWTNLGNARRDLGNAEAAETAYRKALDADPRSRDAANGIGVLLVQSHRAAEAVPWFERALAGSPRFVEAVLNLGIAYQESGNVTKAADQYRRVLEIAPPGSREYQAAATLLKSEMR
jgi:arylsulfatase A-like enzyme/cytochrome c-type biogenesis protein CcmH/NrfG